MAAMTGQKPKDNLKDDVIGIQK